MDYSVQLYTLRDPLDADLPGTIRRLAEIGYTQVEPYKFVENAAAFAAAFAENGIAAPTGHAPLLSGDQNEIFAAAKRLGIRTVIDPFVAPEHWLDEGAIRSTAAQLNAAAKKGAEYGIRVGYHNHSWELGSTIKGTTALEFFASLLDPEVVLEVDVYWVAAGGKDPAALVERLGDRVVALHLKNGPVTVIGSRFDREEFGAIVKTQLPAGQGDVDILGVIAAAKNLEVGVVEFDDYSGDIFEGVASSLRYLEGSSSAVSSAVEDSAK
ncbi:sugar phosphate isomerase/epimerase [Arthrobacter sp. M4]|uniref:sugar phosphate isomerase/epimerase family protein n=1 Tax=Arthrobacter sp. M4 TaxID=218160 RepID=UPI001CDB71D8|nr:sugar phosphate isomerase/epimerase [Arthrobacter sp. M4]MCA4135396.1 sugar phosphate isomerase/epimerase [Arthrobacter sp. M4]